MHPFFPLGPIHGADDEIVVADDVGGVLRKHPRKQILKDILVGQSQTILLYPDELRLLADEVEQWHRRYPEDGDIGR